MITNGDGESGVNYGKQRNSIIDFKSYIFVVINIFHFNKYNKIIFKK